MLLGFLKPGGVGTRHIAFLATGLEKLNKPPLNDDVISRTKLVSGPDLVRMISRGQIRDETTLSCICLAITKRLIRL